MTIIPWFESIHSYSNILIHVSQFILDRGKLVDKCELYKQSGRNER